MRVGVMVTNGGPHPPEKWAEQSANQIANIIEIDPSYPHADFARQQKNLLQDKIKSALFNHHQTVQDHTRQHLKDNGQNLAVPLNEIDLKPHVESALDTAVSSVSDAVKGSMFEQHFAQPHVVQFLRDTLGGHFATVAQIEHSWHRDQQGK